LAREIREIKGTLTLRVLQYCYASEYSSKKLSYRRDSAQCGWCWF